MEDKREKWRKISRELRSEERRANEEALAAVRRYKPAQRRCMCCNREFTSTGPHHRMCSWCRQNLQEGMI